MMAARVAGLVRGGTAAVALVACGPTAFPDGGGSSGGWLTNALPSDGPEPSGEDTWGPADSSSGTAGGTGDDADDTSLTGGAESGDVPWIFEPGDTTSRLICNANGTVRLVIEAQLGSPLVMCEIGPGVDFEQLVAFAIEEWDGRSGTHLVHQDANTFGIFGGEFLVGNLEVTVSEPFVVERLFMEVGNDQATFVGLADLATCATARPPMCGGG